MKYFANRKDMIDFLEETSEVYDRVHYDVVEAAFNFLYTIPDVPHQQSYIRQTLESTIDPVELDALVAHIHAAAIAEAIEARKKIGVDLKLAITILTDLSNNMTVPLEVRVEAQSAAVKARTTEFELLRSK